MKGFRVEGFYKALQGAQQGSIRVSERGLVLPSRGAYEEVLEGSIWGGSFKA